MQGSTPRDGIKCNSGSDFLQKGLNDLQTLSSCSSFLRVSNHVQFMMILFWVKQKRQKGKAAMMREWMKYICDLAQNPRSQVSSHCLRHGTAGEPTRTQTCKSQTKVLASRQSPSFWVWSQSKTKGKKISQGTQQRCGSCDWKDVPWKKHQSTEGLSTLLKLSQVQRYSQTACWVCICILRPQTQWQDLIPNEVSVTGTG